MRTSFSTPKVLGIGQGSSKPSDEPLRTERNPLSPTIIPGEMEGDLPLGAAFQVCAWS